MCNNDSKPQNYQTIVPSHKITISNGLEAISLNWKPVSDFVSGSRGNVDDAQGTS